MANKVVEIVVVAMVENDTITSIIYIYIEMVKKIILKEGATLLGLKTNHTYNVLYVKGMNTINQNVEQNCKMNKSSRQTSSR